MKRGPGVVALSLVLAGCCPCLRDVRNLEWATEPTQATIPGLAWGPVDRIGNRDVIWRSSTTLPGHATYVTGWYVRGEPPDVVPTGVLAKIERTGAARLADPFRQLVWAVAELPAFQLSAYSVSDAVLIETSPVKTLSRHVVPSSTPLSRVQFARFSGDGRLHVLVRHRMPNADGVLSQLGRWTYEIFDTAGRRWAPSAPLVDCGAVVSDGFHPSDVRIFELNGKGESIIGPCHKGFLIRDVGGQFKLVQAERVFGYPFGHLSELGDQVALYGSTSPNAEIEVRRFSDFALRHKVALEGSIRHVARLLADNVIVETVNSQGVVILHRAEPFQKRVSKLLSPKPALKLIGSLPLTQDNFVLLFSGPGVPLVTMETTNGGQTWNERPLR